MITQSELKQRLDYDQHTGLFTRKTSAGGWKAGEMAGNFDESGYIKIRINRKLYYAHRLAFLYVYGRMPELHVDHINGNRADNRICNLREATTSVNAQNISQYKKNNKARVLGVSESPAGRWYARIRFNGKQMRIGTFSTKEEAHEAYLSAKKMLHPGSSRIV